MVDKPEAPKGALVEFWDEILSNDGLEPVDWPEADNPKILLLPSVPGNADDGAREKLFPTVLENADDGAELVLTPEFGRDVEGAEGELLLLKTAFDVAKSEELWLPVLGNRANGLWTMELGILNEAALTELSSGIAELNFSNGWEAETGAEMPEPNWKEGTVENVAAAADTEEVLKLDEVAVEPLEIALAWPSEQVTDAVPGTENEDEDECNDPLLGLGTEEAPKAKLAGVDDVNVPEETVFPNDLNVSPAFWASLLWKMDPCAKVAEALFQQDFKKAPKWANALKRGKNHIDKSWNGRMVTWFYSWLTGCKCIFKAYNS